LGPFFICCYGLEGEPREFSNLIFLSFNIVLYSPITSMVSVLA
jgi:hypothetical protein